MKEVGIVKGEKEAYHLIPPQLLIDILNRLVCLEHRRIIHKHISMPVLLLHLAKKRSNRCWIANISGHNERLDVRMRFGQRVGNLLQLVGVASNKNNCLGASSCERGGESLGSETLTGASDDYHLAFLRDFGWVDCGVDISVCLRCELHVRDEVVDGEVLHCWGWGELEAERWKLDRYDDSNVIVIVGVRRLLHIYILFQTS